MPNAFPVKVQIDGVQIIASAVPIDHWWLGLWPLAALAFFFAWQALT